MRILFATASSGSRGGGELYLLYLASALRDGGHTVALWASDHPQMDELAAKFAPIGEVLRSPYTNTYLHKLRSLSTAINWSESRQIARQWRDWKPDLIHLNKQNLEDGLDLLRACRKSHAPTCCTIHLTQSATYLKARSPWIRDLVARRSLAKYRGVFIAVQEGRAEDLRQFLGRESHAEVLAIPNGVPLIDLENARSTRRSRREEMGITDSEILILGVGRMMPQKRPFLFLDYAEKIVRECAHAQVLWIGTGWLDEEWDAAVKERGLSACVRRLGWQEDVPSWLSAGDVFLHTAEYEGMPLALFEAMSAALPCVITSNLLEDMPFLDRHSVAVAEEITDWNTWLAQSALRKSLGNAGRQLIESQYSHARMAADVQSIYQKLLQKKSS